MWTSVPGIFYCVLVFLFVSESPKWLFTRGRKDEAVATLGRLGHWNHSRFGNIRYLYNKYIFFLSNFKVVSMFTDSQSHNISLIIF